MAKLASQIKLSPKEVKFLEQNEMCRFATSSKSGEPHVVPVSYVCDDTFAYVVTDYGLRKLRIVRENCQRAFIVDSACL